MRNLNDWPMRNLNDWPMRNLNDWPAWISDYDRASAVPVYWGVHDVAELIVITSDFMAAIPRSEQG
ncbi:hypothetical protein E4U45_006616 [Claviceps purpurea]|nr:hypothetical protein E4U45_006616 [Claviceps purpurea]